MPDMLSVEEETALLTDSIRMDHCYTNLSPSSAPATSSTPNHQYGPVASSDTDASDTSFEQELGHQPVVTSSTPTQHSARTRGRVSFQDHSEYTSCCFFNTELKIIFNDIPHQAVSFIVLFVDVLCMMCMWTMPKAISLVHYMESNSDLVFPHLMKSSI